MILDDLAIKFVTLNISSGLETLDETALSQDHLSSFDLLILLKTSGEESATLGFIRNFLKPGGFLLMTAIPPEATDTTCKEIHDTLLSAGFSGIESLEKDSKVNTRFVVLSQAVDDQVSFLRAPLNSTLPFTPRGTLYVIGGLSQETKQFIEVIQGRLKCVWEGEVIVTKSLTDLKSRDFDQAEAVLCLTELDQSVLEGLSPDMFQAVHSLLNKSQIVLWVTHGAENQNPHQSGTIGLVRAVQAENPEKVLQLLDLDTIDGTQCLVAESFLRLIGGVWMRDDNSSRLWTVEPELSVRRRRILIPRVLLDRKRNDRLNCLRRRLETSDPSEKQSATLVLPIDPSSFLSPNKTYVLMGLSGHIGQSITRWIIKSGGRHAVMASRYVQTTV
ncbi:hypothetical protein PRK78_000810 [Emydomyces testavorans]|uniref:HRPKS sdrA-like NAD(P)-binding domain-containing protein n=1 Tax=Emydomyces testavorans TaxID=2070801 RepID=A0AAF0DBU1_9EURO|nr:hypothetical protein PRK78_000810 [Emydomyces testavorans]